jgi:Predicted membrane protein
MIQGQFELPIVFDLGATFAFALSGALAAVRRHYDIVGVFFLALISGLGGGLLRDGIFIQSGPPAAFLDARYLQTIIAATLCGVLLRERVHRFGRVIATIDALGLGAYAVFGTQKALASGLGAPAAMLVGVLNAAGGGILRDVLTREEPLVFKPGQFYVLVAFFGTVVFIVAGTIFEMEAEIAALIAIAATFVIRTLTVWLNWRTTPVAELPPTPPPPRS